MKEKLSRLFSLDDAWSLLGYALLLGVNQLRKPPLPLPMISLLASGMLAIIWFSSGALRTRNAELHPNLRVVFWLALAVISALLAMG